MQTLVPPQTTIFSVGLTWVYFAIVPIMIFIVIYVLYRKRIAASIGDAQFEDDWLDT